VKGTAGAYTNRRTPVYGARVLRLCVLSVLALGTPALAQEDPTPPADGSTDRRTDLDEQAAAERPSTVCRRLIGLTGGFTTTARSWSFVGEGPISLAGSPTFAMTCDVGRQRAAWSVGVEASPFYVTRRIGRSDASARAWLSMSTGLVVGGPKVRGGPMAAFSWGRVGAGGRLLHLPWQNAKGVAQGIEYRLIGYYNGGFELQTSVLYTVSAATFARKTE
jgi:hypothetical protein